MKIAVLAGGLSTERNVSLTTGSMVCRALRELGHQAGLLDVYLGVENTDLIRPEAFFKGPECPQEIIPIPEREPDLEKIKKERGGKGFFGPGVLGICSSADLVFIALHGICGEDGKLQAALELMGIPYTGSDSLGSALAMDKNLTKTLFSVSGIPTAKWMTLCSGAEAETVPGRIGLPCVVKPCSGGSSVGVSIVNNAPELQNAVEEALKFDESVLAEQYIKGREFSVGILGGKALPVIEIIPHEGFYDYKNKYQPGLTDEICPAPLDAAGTAEIQELALRAHKVLHLGYYSRIDFIREESGAFYCLEANTLPGLTPTSLLPQEAQKTGIGYAQLCSRIVDAARPN